MMWLDAGAGWSLDCPKMKWLLKVKVFQKIIQVLRTNIHEFPGPLSLPMMSLGANKLLEGRSDVLVVAIDQLPAGDVVVCLLGLSKLSG